MLTQDEAELYDRQIRLWGVNAQSRIRQSKVLMLGFNGIASEVAKILVLAGIDTITIVDEKPLQESDLTSNLFCRSSKTHDDQEAQFRTHSVKDKLKTLNPLVKVNIDNSPILAKTSDEIKEYDLVTLHSFLTVDETNTINNICRSNNVKFYIVLDFGFFGFMFNDLGPEFKFTYEEFSKMSEEKEKYEVKSHQQSGEKKDPIQVDDGVEDVGYGSSDDEDREPRPKKRIRLHSPVRDTSNNIVKVIDNEKKNIVGSLPYVNFQNMISLRGSKFTKQTNPVLFISIAMYRFYDEHKRLPERSSDEDDISNLNKIITSMKDSLNLHDGIFKKLDQDWSNSIYGSLSPVCAIVGGVAGQDIIRALSNKDIPISNTFSFDGISMSGTVEKVGIESTDTKSLQPIVRDFFQID